MDGIKKWIIGCVIIAAGVGMAFAYKSRATTIRTERADAALEEARTALYEGDGIAAEKAIRPIATESNDEKALALLAQALEKQDRHDAAHDIWLKLEAAHPDTDFVGDILVAKAEAARRANDFVVASDIYKQVELEYPATDIAIRAKMGLADIAWREGDLEAARNSALPLLSEASLAASDRERLETMLGEINLELLFSRQPQEGDTLYTVAKGDYIQKIARNHGISQELLMKINGIADPKLLSIGHRLKIPTLNLRLEVDKFNNTMTVYNNGQFFKKYGVRTGIYDYMTPVGEYTILNKKVNPQWTRPDTGEVVAPGAPDNELGTRWMAFDGSSLGIHGTIKPNTIGKYASQGCVGLSKQDVEELYEYVSIGTTIEITGQQNPDIPKLES